MYLNSICYFPSRDYSFSLSMYDSVVLLILSCIIEIDLLKFRLLCKMPLTTDFSSFVHNCVFIFSDISLSEGEYYLMFVH